MYVVTVSFSEFISYLRLLHVELHLHLLILTLMRLRGGILLGHGRDLSQTLLLRCSANVCVLYVQEESSMKCWRMKEEWMHFGDTGQRVEIN